MLRSGANDKLSLWVGRGKQAVRTSIEFWWGILLSNSLLEVRGDGRIIMDSNYDRWKELAYDGIKWRIWYQPYLTSDSIVRTFDVSMQ
jgi:hypothetical protein